MVRQSEPMELVLASTLFPPEAELPDVITVDKLQIGILREFFGANVFIDFPTPSLPSPPPAINCIPSSLSKNELLLSSRSYLRI